MTNRQAALAVGLPLVLCLAACGPSDPRERVLRDRARWTVTLESWSVRDDGAINLSTRVSGPVRSRLERLTVHIVLQDGEGNALDHEWRTLDLSGIERGGPKHVLLRLEPREFDVEGIGVDTVPDPGPDEIPHIEELRL